MPALMPLSCFPCSSDVAGLCISVICYIWGGDIIWRLTDHEDCSQKWTPVVTYTSYGSRGLIPIEQDLTVSTDSSQSVFIYSNSW